MPKKLSELEQLEAISLATDLYLSPLSVGDDAQLSAPTDQEFQQVLAAVTENDFRSAGNQCRKYLENQRDTLNGRLDLLFDLQPMDIAAGFGIGVFSAMLPSMKINGTSLRDSLASNQDTSIKKFVEKFCGPTESGDIDSTIGRLHRYSNIGKGHDAFYIMSKEYNGSMLAGFAHLFIDAAGKTGIPFPGSSKIRGLINEIASSEIITDRDHSRFMSYRHTDSFAFVATSIFSTAYCKIRKVEPDSIREMKLFALSHGTAAVWPAVAAYSGMNSRAVADRSLLNHVSLLASVRQLLCIYTRSAQNISMDLRVLEEIERELSSEKDFI